jgi:ribosomal-protein-alanine N-acetyltransferase
MGLAVECATGRVDVLACGADGAPLARETETVEHGHAARVTPLVRKALARAGLAPRALRWVAADLGPGSFTGVRVGLATIEALALAAGAEMRGAASLAALAHGAPFKRALLVPLVPAGRRDLYAGWFRTDARGQVRLLGAPVVGALEPILEQARELQVASGLSDVRFLGPGAARERAGLEAEFPGSTAGEWRHDGLAAEDLARAAALGLGPAAGLPAPGAPLEPLYVRSAQAEERVRHRVSAQEPIALRDLAAADVPAVAELEIRIFSDPWPESFFLGELAQPLVYARVAEREGRIAGYSVAWLGAGAGHLGNLATVPGQRRRGVARALMDDLLDRARVLGVGAITLEVRAANFAAQGLYRGYGFRVAGLRRGYYRDTGEDALVMAWSPAGPARLQGAG